MIDVCVVKQSAATLGRKFFLGVCVCVCGSVLGGSSCSPLSLSSIAPPPLFYQDKSRERKALEAEVTGRFCQRERPTKFDSP
jgi:hypothetical protein